ncbi:beta-galactosidase [Virgisporangium aurantiacum]|uniref:Beta-galactosidase n=1 Tax=Virgisporangium aurantiacum TaxID=175570 RepID=A0A8J3Z533_9ACTN|nr:beta-galactosidase [Virgisporangium aurantiacum]GIJ55401.1 beta-galactosidase [Virgisporangium aurantiacum]
MRWPGGLSYGGDYNPEQWPDPVCAEDIALMKRAAVNLVSVGVFAWSRLEPHEGRYEFGWLDRVLDRLAAAGIGVALATPTASPPPWFSLAYPDALPVTATGTRLLHGSRDTYCGAAPAYRSAARRIATALAERYADHPALAMWHVHNEYGTTCHCYHAAGAFRRWLRDRYGTLDALNDAWVTSFWSQHYSSWTQVHPPRATQYLPNPAHVLDFKRFWSDELLAGFVEQRDVLRAATPDVPVTTNFALGDWVPVDHARWARELDLVAIDHYPSGTGAVADEQTALAADTARGWAGGRPWLLMETAANLVYVDGRMRTRPPGQLLRHSLSHVARGSRGAMFFQWRAPRGGAEMYHAAMVPHAGADSRVFREVTDLGSVLRRLPVVDAPVAAAVAVLRDAESAWALAHPGLPAPDLDHSGRVAEVHAALGRLGHTVDVLPVGLCTDAALDRYRAVFVPGVYIASAETASALRSYVDGGGTLVVWYFSGIVDETLRVWPGAYPGAYRDVLGLRVTEVDPLPPGSAVELSTGDSAGAWTEVVELAGAEAVATYPDGGPAITRHRYGDGVAWYVSTRLEPAALTRVLAEALGDDGPQPADGLDLVRRGALLFAINNSTVDRRVDVSGVDVLTGAPVDGALTVPAGAVAVIETGS